MIEWKRRDERKLAGWLLVFMLTVLIALVLFPAPLYAGGLQASFRGSRFDGLTRKLTVAEYWGVVGPSTGDLIDVSGSNYLQHREQFDDWTQSGTCYVDADCCMSAYDRLWIADELNNTAGANTDHRYIATADLGDLTGRTFTLSMWIRADYTHTATIEIVEGAAVGSDELDVTVTRSWNRFWVTRTMVGGGDNTIIARAYPGEKGVSTGIAVFVGAQICENDRWRVGPCRYLDPLQVLVPKPALDLAPTASPAAAKAEVQGINGNKEEAREFDGSAYYSIAHDDLMDINDSDHTYTFLVKAGSAGAGTDMLFSHGQLDTDGMYIYADHGTSAWIAKYNSSGSSVDVQNATDPGDGYYHVVQLVREDDTATVYVDGVAGTGVDVTGEGIDGNQTLYIGRNIGGNYFLGQSSYIRIDNEALSVDELAHDREVLLGIATNWSDVNAWDFERSTTAYKTFSAGGADAFVSHMDIVAVDHPRVAGKGGGLLVEGPSTNDFEYSQEFNQAGSWAVTRLSVVADSTIALDGTTTVDTLHEDNTAASTHFIDQPMDLTNTEDYVFSVYVAPVNRDFVGLRVDDGVTVHRVDFNAANCTVGTETNATGGVDGRPGYCRIWMSFTSDNTAANRPTRIYINEADNDNNFDGLDQDSLYVWGAQFEEGMTFPTSYILTTTAPVTRTADDITLDPHPAGTNEIVLPEEFCDTCAASKLTVYGEFKCDWSGSADIGSTQRSLVEVSGNAGTAGQQRNRLYLETTQTGALYGNFRDDSSTLHSVYTGADPVDYSNWFSVRLVLDFEDLSRMDMWIAQPPEEPESNSGMSYTANTGTATFDTGDTLVRIGQQYNGGIEGHCWTRHLRVVPEEVRP